ncbi:AAA-like domain-containing protein, partial [Arthrospira platensis SPKY1]|nr:AAA-like domain-containing protein [Arthrospira platensis SPKY1]
MSILPPQLELQVGGAVPLDTGIYIARRTDAELLHLLQQGEYCNVLCARQMGKTSAILRVRAQLRREGYRTALLDIAGRIGTPPDADDWYLGLLSQLSLQFQ